VPRPNLRNLLRFQPIRFDRTEPEGPRVLVLTPVKDARANLEGYFRLLVALTYPHRLLSLGLLESDSSDDTFAALTRALPILRKEFRRVGLWKRDFGLSFPPGVHRALPEFQLERRIVLAMSRNHLLFHALDDEDWVLWLDVDLIDYPGDLIERLLATGRDIVQPHCVLTPGGPTFDRNGWRDHGLLHLEDLRAEGDLVRLDAVGGTVLLVRADAHRDGLVFPAFPYGHANAKIRDNTPELETEGFGIMADDLGYRCWGMPNLEVIHRNA
jgi:Anp1 protein